MPSMTAHALDLHGVKHGEVEEMVENFILLNQQNFPLEIIYGNSNTMYGIVTQCLGHLGLTYNSGFQANQFGRLLVLGWKDE